jgi:hypothetical protein
MILAGAKVHTKFEPNAVDGELMFWFDYTMRSL